MIKRVRALGRLAVVAVTMSLIACTGAPKPKGGATPPEPKNSVDMARAMGNGINLGNTMEAFGRQSMGVTGAVNAYETFWGQPTTTQEIINSFKKAGFDSLRVPVAWTNKMDFRSGDYTIAKDYLDRVAQIVDYAIAANMYVVVNDHWDGSWWGMFGSADPATRKAAMELYLSMWKQISERFKDYPNLLIFESANEELGSRLNDTDVAADSGTLSEEQCFATTNAINQAFVDTVRASGGANADRFLLIAGYNTDFDKTNDPRFSMPKDTSKGKLLLSVHYYTPSDYCINSSVNNWGSKDDYELMNAQFKKMERFTQAGYGIVIGEYAVSLKSDGSIKKSTQEYLANLLDNCDLYGYCPMLWDCSSLFKRTKLSFMDEGIAKLYAARNLAAEAGLGAKGVAAAAKKALAANLAKAKAPEGVGAGTALAWIMYSSSDWGTSYSVGDKYNPASKSDGLVAVDPPVTGPGTYTASIDFSGTGAGLANGVAFSAIAVANGEKLFPGYVMEIKQILINGEPVKLAGNPYTTSDDGTCTRVNLYNAWVTAVPKGVRIANKEAGKPSACPLDNNKVGKVKTISVTFEYRPE